jgi:hypothetical protein
MDMSQSGGELYLAGSVLEYEKDGVNYSYNSYDHILIKVEEASSSLSEIYGDTPISISDLGSFSVDTSITA